MRRTLLLSAAVAGLLALPAAASAQDAPGCYLARGTLAEAAERPSPLDSTTVRLDGAEAKVCYGAPRARDRVVMGQLVPFDQPWRTGANEATGIYLTFPAQVAGVEVEPGAYSLYTIPGEESWDVVLHDVVERWGIPIDRSGDIGLGTVPATPTDEYVDQLTFHFEKQDETTAHLVMEWENTQIRIPVQRTGG